jgi:hypothetical protein
LFPKISSKEKLECPPKQDAGAMDDRESAGAGEPGVLAHLILKASITASIQFSMRSAVIFHSDLNQS